jgi:hypothetical protein
VDRVAVTRVHQNAPLRSARVMFARYVDERNPGEPVQLGLLVVAGVHGLQNPVMVAPDATSLG